MRDITLGDTFYHMFTTRQFSDGVPTTLLGTPALSVLEENNATPITSGVSVSVDRASVTGLNQATIVATGGNGFESGKSYAIYISTGTVGGTSVVGEVVGHFTIEASAAAVDLANGTDGLGAIKTDTAAILTDTADIQPNYATSTALAIAQIDLDTLTGSDGATLATSQPNFTPAVAGDSMALTAAAVDGIWDETLTAHATADSAAVHLKDIIADTNELQTDDIPTTLATLATAAALTTVDTEVGNIQTDLDNATDGLGALKTLIDAVKAETALIVADTDSLQTEWADGGRLDNLLDGASAPTAAAVADAVWEETQGDHVSAGTFGAIASEIADILADTNELQTDGIAAAIAALNDVSTAEVLTQVNAALDTAISELGVAAPTATPTIRTALMLMYMALRNKRTTTASADTISNDAGTTITTASLQDDTVTFQKNEYA